MTLLAHHLRLVPICLAMLIAASCDKAKPANEAADAAAEDTTKVPGPAEKRPSLVETPAFGDKPSVNDMIVELVGDEARLVTSSSVGPAVDFAKRSDKDEHIRSAFRKAMDDRFFKALEAKDPHVRVRLDASSTGLDLGDLIHTLADLRVVGWEFEVTTADGPRGIPVGLPPSCFGEKTDRRCTTLHLRVMPEGTLVSLVLTDAITKCDVPAADSGKFAAISGRAITPTGGACPGWGQFVPNDQSLDHLLGAVEALWPLCKSVEVSVDPAVPASKFLPTMAALVAVHQPVVFAAQGRVTCSDGEGVAIDELGK